MKLFNVGQNGNSSFICCNSKISVLPFANWGRRQICPHMNLNGSLAIMQIFEEGEEQKLSFIGLMLLPSLLGFDY